MFVTLKNNKLYPKINYDQYSIIVSKSFNLPNSIYANDYFQYSCQESLFYLPYNEYSSFKVDLERIIFENKDKSKLRILDQDTKLIDVLENFPVKLENIIFVHPRDIIATFQDGNLILYDFNGIKILEKNLNEQLGVDLTNHKYFTDKDYNIYFYNEKSLNLIKVLNLF